MTGEEIARATPWEINHRAAGLRRREKRERIFYANFVTAPLINGGMRAPKKVVKPEDIVPKDFERVTSQERNEEIRRQIMEEEEERRKHGSAYDTGNNHS